MRKDSKGMAPKGKAYKCPDCKAKFNFLPRGETFCTGSRCSGRALVLIDDKPQEPNMASVRPRRYLV